MNKSHYPVLPKNNLVHLDASAAFPLHENVIAAVNSAMTQSIGAPGKAKYSGALEIGRRVEQIRQVVADYIHADASEIFFVASATDAARTIATLWATNAHILYSPEDHSRIIHETVGQDYTTSNVLYKENGEYDYESIATNQPDLAVLSHIHHLYGSDNDIQRIREILPNTKLVIDASQSISRIPINVKNMGCDALFFSAQKIGGIAGVGVLYIAKKHHKTINRRYVEPNTLPVIPLVSLQAAIETINTEQIGTISSYLARMTADIIEKLQQYPSINFTKGPAYHDNMCYGHGIVSFSVDGYSSQDVAMILADRGIQVRAGDHCVDHKQVNQDVVRISMHRYTTTEDLDLLVDTIARL